ncbi:hypothetical protein F4861DRAFT_544687, partial [Xylaria intraflava]
MSEERGDLPHLSETSQNIIPAPLSIHSGSAATINFHAVDQASPIQATYSTAAVQTSPVFSMAESASPQPQPSNAVVVYEPQAFDVVMADAPALASRGTIENPPEWLQEFTRQFAESHDAVVAYSRSLSTENQHDIENLRQQYDQIRTSYTALVSMQQAGITTTQDQINQFQNQMVKSSNLFAHQIYSEIIRYSQDREAQDTAIEQLRAVAIRQEDLIAALTKEAGRQFEFRNEVNTWAAQKELQINELLAREIIDPQQLDANMRQQIEDVRAYTRDVIAEYQNQQRENPE